METISTNLTTEPKPATENQRSYLTNLIAERPCWAAAVGLAPEGITRLSIAEASKWIKAALSITPEHNIEHKRHPDAIALDELEEGSYWTFDGDVVRLRWSRTGYLYGELLNPNEGRFEYVRGIIFRLKSRMSLDEAKEWGARFGRCCVCGKLLTADKSVEQGIGPVCARIFLRSSTSRRAKALRRATRYCRDRSAPDSQILP